MMSMKSATQRHYDGQGGGLGNSDEICKTEREGPQMNTMKYVNKTNGQTDGLTQTDGQTQTDVQTRTDGRTAITEYMFRTLIPRKLKDKRLTLSQQYSY